MCIRDRGNTVKVLDIEFDEEVSYTIVGSTEVNLAENKISNESQMCIRDRSWSHFDTTKNSK